MSNARKPKGLRAALQNRKVKKSFYDIPQVEHEVAQKAAAELVLAKNTLRAAEYLYSRDKRDDIAEAIDTAKAEVAAAEKNVEACFFRVWFVGMPEDDFDALVNAHPPTQDQIDTAKAQGEDLPMWNEQTFPPALLEHCAQESDLTADDWATEIGAWERAERREITSRVLDCNLRSFNASLSFD